MRRRRKKEPGDLPPDTMPIAETEGSDIALNASRGAYQEEPAAAKDDKVPRPSVGWGNVVHDTLTVKDPAGLARRLREELSLGEQRTAYGAVLEALDRSARNLDDAGRLYRAAKVEEETYTLRAEERLEVLRTTARHELMDEYAAKKRPSPTKADIEDRIRASWPDEYRTIRGRIAELHAAVQSLETLRDAWASRCADLRIMADKARPTH